MGRMPLFQVARSLQDMMCLLTVSPISAVPILRADPHMPSLSGWELRPTKHQQTHSSHMNIVPVPCEDGARHTEIQVNGGAVGRDGDLLC